MTLGSDHSYRQVCERMAVTHRLVWQFLVLELLLEHPQAAGYSLPLLAWIIFSCSLNLAICLCIINVISAPLYTLTLLSKCIRLNQRANLGIYFYVSYLCIFIIAYICKYLKVIQSFLKIESRCIYFGVRIWSPHVVPLLCRVRHFLTTFCVHLTHMYKHTHKYIKISG